MTGLRSTAPGAWRVAPNPDALEARVALRIASALSRRGDDLPHHVTERLRVARERALDRARSLRKPNTLPASQSERGALVMSGPPSWWLRLASFAPLALLLAGLLFIQTTYVDQQVRAAAEIDAALLTDDLPPQAYTDPGFVEYLRTPHSVV